MLGWLTTLFDWRKREAVARPVPAPTGQRLEYITLTDGVATYTFTLPKVKFTGGKPEVGGEREVSITMPFQAIYSSSDATQLKIERA